MWVWETPSGWDGCAMLGREGMAGGRCLGTRGPVWGGPQWGRRKETSFPAIAFGERPSQALVRVEAKAPPWINEFQGQLGIQLCQKHPLTQAHESCVRGSRQCAAAWQPPGRAAGAPLPPLWQLSAGKAGSHPGCRGHWTPGHPAALWTIF